MRQLTIIVLACVMLSIGASASVIPAKYTEQKCGNGVREGYELCEPDTAFDICPSIGKLLKIAMVCDERNCACLPDEKAKNCKSEIREGVEMCDPGDKEPVVDFCGNISAAIGLPLQCDTETCDCVPKGPPVVISYCGDGKVEGNEDCESDDDCPKGRTCENCTCIRTNDDLNLTPVVHNVTTDDIAVPTIEDITSAPKTTIAGVTLEDRIGQVLPESLEYFDDEAIVIHLALKDNTAQDISIVTTQMVVQEVHAEAAEDATMEVWVTEDAVNTILASEDKAARIELMLEDGTIKYKPAGFFRRIWFFFFTPF
jgi:hypothetical protein